MAATSNKIITERWLQSEINNVVSGTWTASSANHCPTYLQILGIMDAIKTKVIGEVFQVSHGTSYTNNKQVEEPDVRFIPAKHTFSVINNFGANISGTVDGENFVRLANGSTKDFEREYSQNSANYSINNASYNTDCNFDITAPTTTTYNAAARDISVGASSSTWKENTPSPNSGTMTIATGNVSASVTIGKSQASKSGTVTYSFDNSSMGTINGSTLKLNANTSTSSRTGHIIYTSPGGCTDSVTITQLGDTISSIAVTPTSATVKEGNSTCYTATATWVSGRTTDITNSATWSSGNTSIATHSSNGCFNGVSEGNTSVTASYSGLSGSATVRIVNDDTFTLANNTGKSMTVTIDGTSYTILHGSSKEIDKPYGTVSSISYSNVVLADADSNCQVSVSLNKTSGNAASTTARITASGSHSHTSPSSTSGTIDANQTVTITGSVSTVSDTPSLSVSTGGSISGTTLSIAANTSTTSRGIIVTATNPTGGCQDTATYTQSGDEVSKLTLSCNCSDIEVDGDCTFNTPKLTWISGDVTDASNVTWSSNKTNVATVNNSGKVTGVSAGTATITASSNGFSDTCSIEVSAISVTCYEYTIDLKADDITADDTTIPATAQIKYKRHWSDGSIDSIWTNYNASATITGTTVTKNTSTSSQTHTVTASYYEADSCEDKTVTASVDITQAGVPDYIESIYEVYDVTDISDDQISEGSEIGVTYRVKRTDKYHYSGKVVNTYYGLQDPDYVKANIEFSLSWANPVTGEYGSYQDISSYIQKDNTGTLYKRYVVMNYPCSAKDGTEWTSLPDSDYTITMMAIDPDGNIQDTYTVTGSSSAPSCGLSCESYEYTITNSGETDLTVSGDISGTISTGGSETFTSSKSSITYALEWDSKYDTYFDGFPSAVSYNGTSKTVTYYYIDLKAPSKSTGHTLTAGDDCAASASHTVTYTVNNASLGDTTSCSATKSAGQNITKNVDGTYNYGYIQFTLGLLKNSSYDNKEFEVKITGLSSNDSEQGIQYGSPRYTDAVDVAIETTTLNSAVCNIQSDSEYVESTVGGSAFRVAGNLPSDITVYITYVNNTYGTSEQTSSTFHNQTNSDTFTDWYTYTFSNGSTLQVATQLVGQTVGDCR